jgi:serine/threonine protein kinase
MVVEQSLPGYDRRIIGIGSSAFVSLYDETTVLKGYVVVLNGRVTNFMENEEAKKRSLNQEYEVYKRLARHKSILQCIGQVEVEPNVHSLHLELASKGSLRSFIKANVPDDFGLPLRLAWVMDLATGLAYMHSKRVFHCDFSCRNVLLTGRDAVKICDFGAAELDGKESPGLEREESRYSLPLRGRQWGDRPSVKRDLFALGSAIYEIMAWKMPFTELTEEEVEELFECDKFPDTGNVPCTEVIQRCWNEEYEKAEDVVLALQAVAAM